MSSILRLGILTLFTALLFFGKSYALPNGDNKETPTQEINKNNLKHIHCPLVQERKDQDGNPLDGRDIKVAVIDSGFYTERLPQNQIVDYYNFIRKGYRSNEHGTQVTQAILDIAPKVRLYLYKIKTVEESIDAVNRAIRNKVDVLNLTRLKSRDSCAKRSTERR